MRGMPEMTIEKLPSGSYRVRQMSDGKLYSVTTPYKPSKKEAFELIQNKINNAKEGIAFNEAAEKYISAKNKVLSPATVREYRSILRNLPEKLKQMDLSQIDDYVLQKFVNEYSIDHSPKSTRNVYGFICVVIRLFYPRSNISVTLPQKQRIEHYTPSQDDVKRILSEADGTEYYIPIYLATMSLRNSEICALTIFDLKDDNLTINKALVRSDHGYVLKPTPKTDKSNRTIKIPHDLAERIREKGYIYQGYPQQIDKFLFRTQKRLGIPHFGIHRLRHYFASYAHELGYSDAVIQAVGGWSTDNVMKSVYRHAMNTDDALSQMAEDFTV